jgi:hypothetical protein
MSQYDFSEFHKIDLYIKTWSQDPRSKISILAYSCYQHYNCEYYLWISSFEASFKIVG